MTKTKRFLLTPLVLCVLPAVAQAAEVESRVHPWEGLPVVKTGSGEVRKILEGTSLDLSHLVVEAVTLEPGEAADAVGRDAGMEELVIIKSGKLEVTVDGEKKTLGPGSVAVLLPGGSHAIASHGDAPATFFHFQYASVSGVDAGRGREAGGSFGVDWDEVEYMPSDIGGRRDLYDRPTAMFSEFEMHVSTLDAGLTNHQAHTHRAEEMVLVIEGEVEMLIGEDHYRAGPGDLYFIQSEVPHSLRNIGDGPTEYYAFQWR